MRLRQGLIHLLYLEADLMCQLPHSLTLVRTGQASPPARFVQACFIQDHSEGQPALLCHFPLEVETTPPSQ